MILFYLRQTDYATSEERRSRHTPVTIEELRAWHPDKKFEYEFNDCAPLIMDQTDPGYHWQLDIVAIGIDDKLLSKDWSKMDWLWILDYPYDEEDYEILKENFKTYYELHLAEELKRWQTLARRT